MIAVDLRKSIILSLGLLGIIQSAHTFAQSKDQPENLDGNHWALSVEAISLSHSGSTNQALINQVRGSAGFFETQNVANSTPQFNSNQFHYGYGVGPKISLSYKEDANYSVEASYFNIQNINASQRVGPNGDWLTMYAPGFWQTQDYPNQGMTWSSTTSLTSAEINSKQVISKDFNWIAGIRWLNLKDSLVGSVTPADQYLPAWKYNPSVLVPPCGSWSPSLESLNSCPGAASTTPLNFSNFWTTNVVNNLLGMQLGFQGLIYRIGALTLEGSIKAGIYNNYASQNASVSLAKNFYYGTNSSNQVAYSGDGQILLRYQIAQDISLKLGYQLLWINQVALATGQVSQTYSKSAPAGLVVTGVNTGSNILFQGGTLGFEYTF